MAKKKSKAQIKRLMKRAAARGETYVAPESEGPAKEEEEQEKEAYVTDPQESQEKPPNDASKQQNKDKRMKAAIKLKKDLEELEKNTELKSKERRSAKRKAEAIASETAGCPAAELLEWYNEQSKSKTEAEGHVPYIVFVGQLAYTTTREQLLQHIRKGLGKEHKITEETVKIRLLTDSKTKRSKGMAFVELSDPELLYACLKLHHTYLDGRRINVEKSAGGKRNSDARKSKLTHYRTQQKQYMEHVVKEVLDEYLSRGDIRENELDEGVMLLCGRHSAAVVNAALALYVEKGGGNMDNPSAYLTHLIGKIAEEGVEAETGDKTRKRKNISTQSSTTSKKQRSTTLDTQKGTVGRSLKATSEFAAAGVDLKISEERGGGISSIFPSASRGRGRGSA